MKRLMSLLLAVMMLASSVVFTASAQDEVKFSDVDAKEYFASSVETLVSLGILNGYEDGTFKAENNITRAEMAAVIVRMLNMQEAADKAKGKTNFEDVEENHWASGYINLAVSEGIISGDGNGKFRPGDNVKHEEAIKMVVCAQGLGEDVKSSGSDWAKPYLDIADEKGISESLEGEKGEFSTRGDIAVMVCNGLAGDLTSPEISLKSGTYTGTQTITLSTETENADIYYTTDGKDPAKYGTKYEAPISMKKTGTIKAVTVKHGIFASEMAEAKYVISQLVPDGGGGSVSKYAVTFDLNYDGADSDDAPAKQTVKKGKTASEPDEPVREGYVFLGWFTDKNRVNEYDFNAAVNGKTTLYAGWGNEDLYSISDIIVEAETMDVKVEASADTAATVKVELYNQDSRKKVGEGVVDIESGYSISDVDVSLNGELDDYFVAMACMYDENGGMLCKTYTTLHYTREYEEFLDKTVDDFPGKNVINFDEDKTNNFAVLNDEVQIAVSNQEKNIFVESESDKDNGIYVFDNIDETLTDLSNGEIIYFDLEEDLIFTVDSAEYNGGKVIIRTLDDISLESYYDFVKIDVTLDPGNYGTYDLPLYTNIPEEQTELMSEASLMGTDIEVEIAALNFTLPVKLEIKNRNKTMSGTFEASYGVSVKPSVKIAFDIDFKFDWFNSRIDGYFEFSAALATSTNGKVSLNYGNNNGAVEEEVSETEFREALEDAKKIPGVKIPIPFGIAGLGAELELTVGVSLEFKAGAEYTYKCESTKGIKFDLVNGIKFINENSDPEYDIKVGGDITVKAGPQLKESLTWCKKIIKASLVQDAGIKFVADGKSVVYEDDFEDDSRHCCTFCVAGNISLFLDVSAELSYNIIDGVISGTPLKGTIVSGEIELAAFHLSIPKGFGWAECKNYEYKTLISTVNSEGEPVQVNSLKIFKKENGSYSEYKTTESTDTVHKLYLPNGEYKVEGTYEDKNASEEFRIHDAKKEITLEFEVLSGILEGVVAEAENRNTMISGAKINVMTSGGEGKLEHSGADGRYKMNLPAGVYTLKVSKTGYKTFTHQNIEVESGQTEYVETFLMVEEGNHTGSVKGEIKNSVTGIVIPGVRIEVRENWGVVTGDIVAEAYTGSNGVFTISELPTGNYTALLVKDNYITTHYNYTVLKDRECIWNGSMVPENSEELPEGELRIKLSWGQHPYDLDSHLIGPSADGNGKFHIAYYNMRYNENDTRYADLDTDDVTSYGPENTTVYTKNEEGKYRFYIHDYTNRHSLTSYAMSNSGAQIEVYIGGEIVRVFNVPANTPGTVWCVFEYDAATNAITPINTMAYVTNPGDVGASLASEDCEAAEQIVGLTTLPENISASAVSSEIIEIFKGVEEMEK